ncbi:MAG: hemin uptake protein HemP [Methylococcus sp.]|nr:MAG: hemin uptake protein HemP [Methylococcus sp.]
MNDDRVRPAKSNPPGERSPSRRGERPLTTDELFGSRQEIVIVHQGDEYRLRITRNNKLILTK